MNTKTSDVPGATSQPSHAPRFRRDHGVTPARNALLAMLAAAITACGGGGGDNSNNPTPSVTYSAKSGLAQKGPLTKGSTVTVQELDARLSAAGKQYSYQITSDLGAFAPTAAFASQYVGVSATGSYFDEVANGVSSGVVTLEGYTDLKSNSVLNVNLLTTLASARIKHLIAGSGLSVADATARAEGEVLTALNIPVPGHVAFGSLDLGGNTDGDHMLVAVSSMFAYGNSAGPLAALIVSVRDDIAANGAITDNTTKAKLAAAAKGVDPQAVATHLTQKYASLGVTFSTGDIAGWLDRDGDGVIGQFKYQVADAVPSSVFAVPASLVNLMAGTNVSVTAGILSVNGTRVTDAVQVHSGDVVSISPGTGPFPSAGTNGLPNVLNVYLMSGSLKMARVSFISGLVSIDVTPATPSVPKGLTQQFTATGTFSDTSTADVTTSVQWESATSAVATVNATSGLAQTRTVGSAVISAKSGSVVGNTTLNVTAATLQSISIASAPASVGIDSQLTATGTYSDATTANVTSAATWTSDTPSVATVGPTTGLLHGVSAGTTTISATVGAVSGSKSLNVVVGAWSAVAPMSVWRDSATATLLPNGKVLAAGGGLAQASTEIYDPLTNTWSSASRMQTGRTVHAAVLLQNGKVLVVGGLISPSLTGLDLTPTATAELYDPVTNTWSSAGTMAVARSRHTVTLLSNGKVLVTGGIDPAYNILASVEIYDPATNSWSPAAGMANARSQHTATLLPGGGGDLVLVASGRNAVTTGTQSAEIYAVTTDTWTSAGNLTTARWDHTATLLPDGKVLVTGGSASNGAYAVASTEIYDPGTNTWSAAANMAAARTQLAAILLQNGLVLVTGGYTIGNDALASAQLYDPTSNAWTNAASMSYGRSGPTATLLTDGRVLVFGGTHPVTGTAELYSP